MSTPEQEYIDIITRTNTSEEEYFTVFDKLKPVTSEKLIGSWEGTNVDSNHPAEQKLALMKWAGKDFHSTEDFDPVMVYKDDGSRVWNAEWGHACLRQIEWRGVVSTAMIYDNFPIIDYFRYVSDSLLAGAMESKNMEGIHFFYLHK